MAQTTLNGAMASAQVESALTAASARAAAPATFDQAAVTAHTGQYTASRKTVTQAEAWQTFRH